MKRCINCDIIKRCCGSNRLCQKHTAERILIEQTGLCLDDLPDGLPIEDFIDENEFLDYDEISNW